MAKKDKGGRGCLKTAKTDICSGCMFCTNETNNFLFRYCKQIPVPTSTPVPAISTGISEADSKCMVDTDCPEGMVCAHGGLVCMYPLKDEVETITPKIIKMCFLPGRMMVQRSRPLIDIHVVKCEANEKCVKLWPNDPSNIGGEDLG